MLSPTAKRLLISRTPYISQTYSAKQTSVASRRIHNSPACRMAQKDAQDKDSLKPRSTEYSKSGSDDHSAAMEQAAFDPKQTSPEEEMGTADEESGEVRKRNDVSPLDVSPANQGVSQARSSTEGGAEGSSGESSGSASGRQRTSGKGSPNKGGGGKSG